MATPHYGGGWDNKFSNTWGRHGAGELRSGHDLPILTAVRIALFGATGFIGHAFLEEALARGDDVRALARDPARVSPRPNLEVIEGDVSDSAALDRVIAGAGAVVSLLGPRRGDSNQPDFLAGAMALILASMASQDVKRLVTVSGAAVRLPGEQKGFPHNVASALVSVLARPAYLAKKAELEVVLASSVDWTAIRPTRVVEGEVTEHARVSLTAGGVGFSVTRADLAHILWSQLRDPAFVRQAPYVSS